MIKKIFLLSVLLTFCLTFFMSAALAESKNAQGSYSSMKFEVEKFTNECMDQCSKGDKIDDNCLHKCIKTKTDRYVDTTYNALNQSCKQKCDNMLDRCIKGCQSGTGKSRAYCYVGCNAEYGICRAFCW